jgi:hypothetical protein
MQLSPSDELSNVRQVLFQIVPSQIPLEQHSQNLRLKYFSVFSTSDAQSVVQVSRGTYAIQTPMANIH